MNDRSKPTISEQALAKRDEIEGEVMPLGGALPALPAQTGIAAALARVEIDQQIATAHAFPRNLQQVKANISSLVSLDDETAEECVYAISRGGKAIRGPSIRMAEIVFSCYGNARSAARVINIDRIEKIIQAEGIFHDLERNTYTAVVINRRISSKEGNLFNDDMIAVTGNAACSIAKRNAILAGVPKALWRNAFFDAEDVIAGDVKTLVERRDRALKVLAAVGVSPGMACEFLEVPSIEEVNTDHLVDLKGLHTGLKSGEATVEGVFGNSAGKKEPKKPTDLDKKTGAAKGKAAGGKKAEPKKEAEKKPTGKPAAKAKPEPEKGESSEDNGKGKASDKPADEPKPEGADDTNEDKAPSGDDSGDDNASAEKSPEDEAYDRGVKAAESGISVRAIPPEFRKPGHDSEQDAWLSGHNETTQSTE